LLKIKKKEFVLYSAIWRFAHFNPCDFAVTLL